MARFPLLCPMSMADLWHFVRTQGAQTQEIVIALFGLLLLVLGVYTTRDTVRLARTVPRQLVYGNIVGPLSGFFVGAVFLFGAWGLVDERYLLRPGAGRYTIGTVTEHYWQRGRQKYVVVYYVAGQHHQTGEACGIANNQNVPCPALGARRYIYFSPEDPTTQQVLPLRVPDFITTVPPLGWERLPK